MLRLCRLIKLDEVGHESSGRSLRSGTKGSLNQLKKRKNFQSPHI
jgi:hypothetical protein